MSEQICPGKVHTLGTVAEAGALNEKMSQDDIRDCAANLIQLYGALNRGNLYSVYHRYQSIFTVGDFGSKTHQLS